MAFGRAGQHIQGVEELESSFDPHHRSSIGRVRIRFVTGAETGAAGPDGARGLGSRCGEAWPGGDPAPGARGRVYRLPPASRLAH